MQFYKDCSAELFIASAIKLEPFGMDVTPTYLNLTKDDQALIMKRDRSNSSLVNLDLPDNPCRGLPKRNSSSSPALVPVQLGHVS